MGEGGLPCDCHVHKWTVVEVDLWLSCCWLSLRIVSVICRITSSLQVAWDRCVPIVCCLCVLTRPHHRWHYHLDLSMTCVSRYRASSGKGLSGMVILRDGGFASACWWVSRLKLCIALRWVFWQPDFWAWELLLVVCVCFSSPCGRYFCSVNNLTMSWPCFVFFFLLFHHFSFSLWPPARISLCVDGHLV